jgi:acyl-CoA synthetase (AMP-forming)/AMP-acid ligase II
VSNISGREILKQKKKNMLAGQGTCIGKAAPGVEIKIIKVTDEALTKVHEVENGVKGEIIVSSDTVTPEYYLMEEKTKLAKIPTKKFWHRMGDIGYLDDEGYLWFCGRKSHRVQTSDEEIYSIPVESIFNQHEEVSRTALISLGKGNVGLVVERKDKKRKLKKEQQEEFEAQLLKLAQKTSSTSKINKFFYHSSFPVDGRHNIKIDRLELGRIFRGEK